MIEKYLIVFSYENPSGNHTFMPSPTMRPKAAPILNAGTKTPVGTGKVAANIDNQNVANM